MKVVSFHSDHVDTVVKITEYFHKYSIYRQSPYNADGMRNSIIAQLANPNVRGWALVDDKGVCRGAMLVMVGSAYGCFYDVAMDTFYAVDKKAKGRGLMLLNECVRWAKAHPTVQRVVFNLSAGTPDQGRTESLYKRLGMEQVGSSWSLEV